MNEQITVIFENDKMRVERIQSFGNSSPEGFWYDQAADEWVFVIEGYAVLEFKKEKVELKTGDNYYIKANEQHRIVHTSFDCKWLCIFLKRRDSVK